jgi:hypothetical protein
MHRVLRMMAAVILLTCTASRCTQIRTSINNKTGVDIHVVITSVDEKVITYGDVPVGSGLDLEEGLNVIGRIDYKYSTKKCSILQSQFFEIKSRQYNSDTIDLKRCDKN